MPESDHESSTLSATAVQPDSNNKFTRPYKSSTTTRTQTSEEPAIRSWPVMKEPESGTSCERRGIKMNEKDIAQERVQTDTNVNE